MKAFEYYLNSQKLAPVTIRQTLNEFNRYLQWAAAEGLHPLANITYNELLSYVQHMKQQGISVATINIRLLAVRKYYDHLKAENTILKNPARNLHIKGKIQTVTEQPLTYAELMALYQQYHTYSKDKPYHLRNTALLGLLIHQGIHAGEAATLEPQHLQLSEGVIYIPSTKRSKSRTLALEARQILHLYQYLETLPATAPKLFAGSTKNHCERLKTELQGINPLIRNLQHIRASVFLYWLKIYDKRQVQYRAGHKYISSTEHYEQQEITTLTDELQKHHPFG